jgi:hypothetical protein
MIPEVADLPDKIMRPDSFGGVLGRPQERRRAVAEGEPRRRGAPVKPFPQRRYE